MRRQPCLQAEHYPLSGRGKLSTWPANATGNLLDEAFSVLLAVPLHVVFTHLSVLAAWLELYEVVNQKIRLEMRTK